MPFILKDETANVNILYIDNIGQAGLMGSANAGQALSFAGVSVISSGAYFADAVATAGCASSLSGTIVIPISGSGSIGYSLPQVPTVTASAVPSAATTTSTQFTNSSTTSALTVNYNIW